MLEILEENQITLGDLRKKEKKEESEIVLSQKTTQDIGYGLNKEVIQGLSAFGIKQR